jgi:hypothetical protein
MTLGEEILPEAELAQNPIAGRRDRLADSPCRAALHLGDRDVSDAAAAERDGGGASRHAAADDDDGMAAAVAKAGCAQPVTAL